MAANDEYELLPHEEVENLRKQIESLKTGESGSSVLLLDSVKKLTNSMNSLLELFKEASEEMKLEERENEIISQKIDPLIEKMDMILDENQKIAKGIITLADMINDLKDEISRLKISAPKPFPEFEAKPIPPKEPEFPKPTSPFGEMAATPGSIPPEFKPPEPPTPDFGLGMPQFTPPPEQPKRKGIF